MRRIKGVPSLIIIVAVVWLILRAVHLLIPAVRPEVLTGPFPLGSLNEAEEITGFLPWIPVYHPVSLGSEPIRIVAEREPERMVTIVWRSERFLELIETRRSDPVEPPADAEPVDGLANWWFWRRGGAIHMAGPMGVVQISLRTNLSREDAVRMASTLVPLNQVR